MFDGRFSSYYWTSPVMCTVSCDLCRLRRRCLLQLFQFTRCSILCSIFLVLPRWCGHSSPEVLHVLATSCPLDWGSCQYMRWLCMPSLWATVPNFLCDFSCSCCITSMTTLVTCTLCQLLLSSNWRLCSVYIWRGSAYSSFNVDARVYFSAWPS